MKHPPIETLETARLILRPLTLDDAPALHAMFGDTQTMRFMPSLPHQSIAETEQQLARDLTLTGAYYWGVCLKATGELIGQINYLGQTRIPGLGYIIRREYWGQGITVEACRAALDFGFYKRQYDRVELWIDETNFASQRVAQKLGFLLKGTIPLKYPHNDTHRIMLVYGMLSRLWRSSEQTAVSPQGARFFQAQPVLLVHDVPRTVAFYQDSLGFGLDFQVGDPPDYAGVFRGDWTGRIVQIHFSQVPPQREIQVGSYLYIFVDSSIDHLYADYRAKEVHITSPLHTQAWGMREFAIRDINGHLLRFGTQV